MVVATAKMQRWGCLYRLDRDTGSYFEAVCGGVVAF